ncbi:MAG: hypothetical protein JWP19_2473 [Rhodoglobus sp.]|nr:hypothetical protein [Rhodoglobus sp.]
MSSLTTVLATGASVFLVATLSGCIGGGSHGGGPAPDAATTPSAETTAQTTGQPCDDGLADHLNQTLTPGLVPTPVDPTTFSGPASHATILAGLPLSCDYRINGEADLAYFYGEHQQVQDEMAKRLAAEGFTRADGSTAEYGVWTHPDGTVVSVVYSASGGDVIPPGGGDPIPGVGPNEWVCVYIVR